MLESVPFHPAVVHLVIGGYLLAFIFQAGAYWLDSKPLRHAACFTHFTATIAILIAALSGRMEQMRVLAEGKLGGEADILLNQHAILGYILILLFIMLLGWRIFRRGKYLREKKRSYISLMIVTAVILIYTSALGGKMVYQYGVGVQNLSSTQTESESP